MVKIVILTQSTVLGQGLAALLNAMTEGVYITVVKSTASALEAIARQEPALMILDGRSAVMNSPFSLAAEQTRYCSHPILLLMDSADQAELARREQLTPLLKGIPTAELIFAIESLLPLGNLPQMDETGGGSDM